MLLCIWHKHIIKFSVCFIIPPLLFRCPSPHDWCNKPTFLLEECDLKIASFLTNKKTWTLINSSHNTNNITTALSLLPTMLSNIWGWWCFSDCISLHSKHCFWCCCSGAGSLSYQISPKSTLFLFQTETFNSPDLHFTCKRMWSKQFVEEGWIFFFILQ